MPGNEDNTPTEVRIPGKHRTYSARYELRILEQLDGCSQLGDKGALRRREGLYHSTISRWRRQIASKTKTSPGRPKRSALQKENERLRRQLEVVQGRLTRAETVIDVQWNTLSALGAHVESGQLQVSAVQQLAGVVPVTTACASGIWHLARCRPVWRTSLLEQGVYAGHWRTFYRILQAVGESRERRAAHTAKGRYATPRLVARAPGQAWTRDITMLRGPGRWVF